MNAYLGLHPLISYEGVHLNVLLYVRKHIGMIAC
jgi:hypothetical protein